MKQHITAVCTVLAMAAALSAPAQATRPAPAKTACSDTTKAAHAACLYSGLDEFWINTGKCRNEKDAGDRESCLKEARTVARDATTLCGEQRTERKDLCEDLGEAPYDPAFERSQFVDPRQVGKSIAPNPWFPLIGGRTLVYESGDETVRVVTTDKVKIIDNVPCLVVTDTVEINGAVFEATVDWFAQDVQGNVWYCGEATAEYGEDGIPVSVDGSFQADENGASPGIIMKGAPAVGNVYRQEFDLGNAEDAAEVINLHGSATTPVASCAGTCLVTEEFTPLSPGNTEHKYYMPGVGFIYQVKIETGEILQLVEIIN